MAEKDVFDDGDQNKRRKQLAERLVERNKSDMRKVMSMKEGRRVVWNFLKETRVFSDTFDPNALVMAKQNGESRIGKFILARITPDEELRMKTEAASDELFREVEFNQTTGGNNG